MENQCRIFLSLAAYMAACILLSGAAGFAEATKLMSDYNILPDAKTDNTAAIQKAMDDIASSGGGKLELPAGKYLVAGSLKVPPGVTFQGVDEAPKWSDPLTGTVILATGGRGNESGPSLFELGHSSAVRGITVYYPELKTDNIVPYPWTFRMYGHDNTVENVTLINSYNGIKTGPENNVRHRIRSVYGCVLRRGISIDFCTDIGRIDNVQFHCHWWSSPAVEGNWDHVFTYMWKNLEAFIFARTDWEYVNNTFVFPVNIGYKFIASDKGVANGQLSGVGADAAQRCIVVEHLQPMGLLVTNGQFVAFHGEDPTQIVINETNTGSVRLVNCAFWGPSHQNIVSHSRSFLSLNDCFLGTWHQDNKGKPLIEVDSGRLQVRGCSFETKHTAIHLKPGVKHAIISENNGNFGVSIKNEIGDKAIIVNNEEEIK